MLICLTTIFLECWVYNYQHKSLKCIAQNIYLQLPDLDKRLNVKAVDWVDREKKISEINSQLQPHLDFIAKANPSKIISIYSKNLEAVVARSPSDHYGQQIGKSIAPNHPSQKIYRVGKPFFDINKNLDNHLVSRYYIPIFEQRSMVGHLVVMEPIANYLSQLLQLIGQFIFIIFLLIAVVGFWIDNFRKNMTDHLTSLQESVSALKIERQIQRSDQLKIFGEIAATTAHEIRNPLTVMRGISQIGILSRELHDKDSYFQYLIKEIDYLDNLLAQLILLSDQQDSTLDTIDLKQIFINLLKLLHGKALLQQIKVRLNFPDSVPHILGNVKLLKQAFLNLLSNAFEAMPQGGKLEIEASYLEIQQRVRLVVKDTGIGISQENMDKLFTPFFTTKSTGTGLGLSITHKIIEEDHQGFIYLESQEGRGTAVYLELPLKSQGEQI